MSRSEVDVLALLGSGAQKSYDGEPVSELDHALQTAARARADGADDELVLAALVHDLGRIPGVCAGAHEGAGALFPGRVGWIVANHVRAKRWLVAQDPTYEISPVSRASLMLQGGPATPRQVQRWARHPWWGDALRLRRWDDAAKVAGLAVPGLAEYAPLLV